MLSFYDPGFQAAKILLILDNTGISYPELFNLWQKIDYFDALLVANYNAILLYSVCILYSI